MKIYETSKFNKIRKKLKESLEKEALKAAIQEIARNPQSGKKSKGNFARLRSYKYTVKGQPRRLIYLWEKDSVILFSFGPREGIYE